MHEWRAEAPAVFYLPTFTPKARDAAAAELDRLAAFWGFSLRHLHVVELEAGAFFMHDKTFGAYERKVPGEAWIYLTPQPHREDKATLASIRRDTGHEVSHYVYELIQYLPLVDRLRLARELTEIIGVSPFPELLPDSRPTLRRLVSPNATVSTNEAWTELLSVTSPGTATHIDKSIRRYVSAFARDLARTIRHFGSSRLEELASDEAGHPQLFRMGTTFVGQRPAPTFTFGDDSDVPSASYHLLDTGEVIRQWTDGSVLFGDPAAGADTFESRRGKIKSRPTGPVVLETDGVLNRIGDGVVVASISEVSYRRDLVSGELAQVDFISNFEAALLANDIRLNPNLIAVNNDLVGVRYTDPTQPVEYAASDEGVVGVAYVIMRTQAGETFTVRRQEDRVHLVEVLGPKLTVNVGEMPRSSLLSGRARVDMEQGIRFALDLGETKDTGPLAEIIFVEARPIQIRHLAALDLERSDLASTARRAVDRHLAAPDRVQAHDSMIDAERASWESPRGRTGPEGPQSPDSTKRPRRDSRGGPRRGGPARRDRRGRPGPGEGPAR